MNPNVPPPPPGFVPLDAPPPPPGFVPLNTTPEAAPTVAQQAGRAARVGADGFTRGVSNFLGFPVDAATALINTIAAGADMIPGVDTGRIQDPVGGSDFIYDAITAPGEVAARAGAELTGQVPASGSVSEFFDNAQGFGQVEPENTLEQILAGAFQGIGEAVTPVGAALNTTKNAFELAKPAGNAVSEIFRAMQRGAQARPASFTAREMGTAAAVGAGVEGGAAWADDGDDSTTTFWEAVAPILGGLTAGGTVAAGEGIVRTGDEMLRSITGDPDYAMDGAKEAVSRYLGERAGAPIDPTTGALDTDPVAGRIRGGPDLSETVPGYQPTLAERLPGANIRAAEYNRQTGPNSGTFTDRREANANAVTETMDGLAPQGDAALFRRNLDDAITREIETRVAAAEAAQRELDTALDATRVDSTATSRGSDIRAGLVEARDEALARVDEIFSQVDGQDIQIDLEPLRARFNAVVETLPLNDRARFLPPEVGTARALAPEQESVSTGVLDAQGRPVMRDPETTRGSLQEATSIRSGLSSDIRAAATTDQQRRIGSQFRTQVDEFFNDMVADAESGLTPEARDALTEGQRQRFDIGRRFETPGTAVGDVLRTTDRGEFRADPSSIPGRFAQPDNGRVQDFSALLREAGNNEQVRAALADQIASDAQPFLGRPEALRKFLSDRSIVLDEFPELRERLGTVANATETATAARTASDETTKALSPGGRTPEGQYTRFGTEDALSSMNRIVSDDRPAEAVQALLARAGDTPANREGLKAAFWQVLRKRARPVTESNRTGAGEDTWSYTSLYRALEDKKLAAAAQQLYADNPAHLEDLRKIATELRTADPVMTAKARGSSGTPQGAQTSGQAMLDAATPNTETLGAYAFAYQRGQVGLPFIATRLGAVAARRMRRTAVERQMEAVLDRALLDPEYAATLMTEFNPAAVRAFAESSAARGIVLSSEFLDALAAPVEQDRDEVQDAITGEQP